MGRGVFAIRQPFTRSADGYCWSGLIPGGLSPVSINGCIYPKQTQSAGILDGINGVVRGLFGGAFEGPIAIEKGLGLATR